MDKYMDEKIRGRTNRQMDKYSIEIQGYYLDKHILFVDPKVKHLDRQNEHTYLQINIQMDRDASFLLYLIP